MDIKDRKQLRAEVKRVNTRIATIANKFGLESQTYKNTIAPYLNEKTSKITHTTNKGILQINTNIKSLNMQSMPKLIKTALRTVPTLTRIKGRVKTKIKSEFGEEPKAISEEQLLQLYEKSEETEFALKSQVNFLYEYLDDEERKAHFPELYKENRGKRQLTYDELDTFYERLQELAKKEGRSKEFEREVFA